MCWPRSDDPPVVTLIQAARFAGFLGKKKRLWWVEPGQQWAFLVKASVAPCYIVAFARKSILRCQESASVLRWRLVPFRWFRRYISDSAAFTHWLSPRSFLRFLKFCFISCNRRTCASPWAWTRSSGSKNYRNVTYHNWHHAFKVAQEMFAIVTARPPSSSRPPLRVN